MSHVTVVCQISPQWMKRLATGTPHIQTSVKFEVSDPAGDTGKISRRRAHRRFALQRQISR